MAKGNEPRPIPHVNFAEFGTCETISEVETKLRNYISSQGVSPNYMGGGYVYHFNFLCKEAPFSNNAYVYVTYFVGTSINYSNGYGGDTNGDFYTLHLWGVSPTLVCQKI